MDFELLIALSHLRSRRQDAGISLIAVLSVLGVMLGVAVLIVVLSVMEGFEIDLRQKILGNQAHILVLENGGPLETPADVMTKVEGVQGVEATAPFTYSEVMITTTYGVSGSILKGIDPERALTVNELVDHIEAGPDGRKPTREEGEQLLRSLHTPRAAVTQDLGDDEQLPGIILGTGLADTLRAYVGAKVRVVNPLGTTTGPMGVPIATARNFRVAALVHTGMYEYDTKWAYLTIGDAQEFMGIGTSVTGLEVRVPEADVWDATDVGQRIEMALGPGYYAKNWLTMNEALFKALALEKWVMGIILAQIVAVAALGIVTNLVVMVVTRGREIAILKAMGATSRMIRLIFMLEGVTVGVVGTGLGVLLGLAGCAVLSKYKYPLDTNVYYIDSLPVVVVPSTVAVVALGALLICFVATLYPSSRAAALHPVEGLRYE